MNKKLVLAFLILAILFSGCTEDGVGQPIKPLIKEKDLTPKETCVPSTEVCDGKDNDCDALTDEEGVCVKEEEFPLIEIIASEEKELTIEEINKKIKEKGVLWKAEENEISKLSLEEKKKLLGVVLTEEEKEKIKQDSVLTKTAAGTTGLPDFFDWRNYHKKNYITEVKNQGACGSCWAFAAVAVLEAHANAYYNNPDLDLDLSEQDLVSCYLPVVHGMPGCGGSHFYQTEQVFSDYFQNTGIATESCFPYTATDIDCKNKCSKWENDSWKTFGYESVPLTVEEIKRALIEKGPMEVAMVVYSDFYGYTEGIYSHTTEFISGSHAVTLIGWGIYDGIDYWIAKNSWGTDWGENGYFKILIGDSEIDSIYAFAVTEPNPPVTQNKICEDNDADGYCFWGLGNKPATGCPDCDDFIFDCDDSDSDVFEECSIVSGLGFLNITSNPEATKIYVKDFDSGKWVYRGQAPLNIKLNAGEREVKASFLGYDNFLANITVSEGETKELFITLTKNNEEGWPKLVPGKIDGLTAGDVDGDKEKEIIAADSYSGNLYAFNPDGTSLLEGVWPMHFDAEKNPGIPSLADLDNDNKLDIISVVVDNSIQADQKAQLFAWKYDGTVLQGFPTALPGKVWPLSPPVLADLDADGFTEIILRIDDLANSPVYVYEYNYETGSLKIKWTANAYTTAGKVSPAVGDLDKDGFLEVVVSSDSAIHVFDKDGKSMSNWPKEVVNAGFTETAFLGDIAGDESLEIIIFGRYTGRIYAFDLGGNLLWSVNVGATAQGTERIALADVDKDGKNEIIGNQYVIKGDGTFFSQWTDNGLPPKYSFKAPIAVDIDNDSIPEIFYGDEYKVYGYEADGTPISGFSKNFPLEIVGPIGVRFSPLIDDLDNDGKLEMAVESVTFVYPEPETYDWGTYLYVWELEDYDPKTLNKFWKTPNHDSQRTNSTADFYVCGDITREGQVNAVDVVYIVNYVYRSLPEAEDMCYQPCADINDDDIVNPIDVVHMVNYVYKNISWEEQGINCPCGLCEGTATSSTPPQTYSTLEELTNAYPELEKDLEEIKITTTITK